jgi:hypothetical protein
MKHSQRNIIGKVIALTKQIYLMKPENESGFSSSFFAGKQPFQSFGLEWWLTKKASSLCEEIADMAISFDNQLRGGDRESFCITIKQTLQENSGNSKLFDSNCLFLRQAETLFDARANNNNIQEFATSLWSHMHSDLVGSISHWLILYPLRQVGSSSFNLNFDGISILSSTDQDNWQKYSKHYLVGDWNPVTGYDASGSTMNDFIGVPTWLLCEVSGTALGARQLAKSRMRTFIAILFSFLDAITPALLSKSGANVASYSIQFPSNGNCGRAMASIGELVPPLLTYPIKTLECTLIEVQDWYTQRSQAHEKSAQRANVASHFLHYGIMDSELDRFIHFFITLDSLFGERSQVEENIKKGINHTFLGDSTWEKRAEYLFKLRNDLIHGGISQIRDWERLDHYRRYFKSHPMNDVKTAAMIGLKNYFKLKTFEHLFTDKLSGI